MRWAAGKSEEKQGTFAVLLPWFDDVTDALFRPALAFNLNSTPILRYDGNPR
jgi:hypothetical protein